MLEMTWAEYLIRIHGYLRQQERQMARDRRTWFYSLVGAHLDPKTLPKSEEQFMPLPRDKEKRHRASQAMTELLEKRQQEFKQRAKHGKPKATD